MLDMTKLTVSDVLSKIENPDQYITLSLLQTAFDEQTIGFYRRSTMVQPNKLEENYGKYIVKNIGTRGSRLLLEIIRPDGDDIDYKSLNKSIEDLLPPLDDLTLNGNENIEMPYSKPKEVEVTCYANKNIEELLRT